MLKNIRPALPERGKIKIGIKGQTITSGRGNQFQPPQKLDHFVVTTIERGPDGNFLVDDALMARLGPKPTQIPIRLLYDDPDLNFPTRYAAYNGRTLWCSGDGEIAQRRQQDGGHCSATCPCPNANPEYDGPAKCKMNGVLSAMIDGAGGVGGVWKFRTTSYNSIVGIASALMFLRSVTGGVLANIPLKLVVRPKQATDPRGKPVTIYIVAVEFAGAVEDLQEVGHKIALARATTHVSIQQIEDEARRVLALPAPNAPLAGDNADEVIDEFYPEEATGPRAAPLSSSETTQTKEVAEPEAEAVDAETGEAHEDEESSHNVPVPINAEGSGSDWPLWCDHLFPERVAACQDAEEFQKVLMACSAQLDFLKAKAPKRFAKLQIVINDRLAALTTPAAWTKESVLAAFSQAPNPHQLSEIMREIPDDLAQDEDVFLAYEARRETLAAAAE